MSEPGARVVHATDYDRRAGERAALNGEQLAAVTATNPTVAVSAGAGSGKTTVLVERFLNFVTNDDVSPLNILAITYTEKAAAEMKERIIRRFEERGDERNRRRAEAAYISTIHGFCARLLRENPLAAGVDPSFEILDDWRRGLFLDEERERMFADSWFLEARSLFPARKSVRDPLVKLVEACVFQSREFGKGIPDEEAWDTDQHVAAAMRRLDRYCVESWLKARSALLGVSDDVRGAAVSGPKSSSKHQRMCALLSRLSELETLDPEWAGEFLENTGFTLGVKDTAARAAIKAVTDPVRKTLIRLTGINRAYEEEIERDCIAPLKVGIYRHARALRAQYELMKASKSLLDFDDLQKFAMRLLERTDIRAEYASRFQHILLDEAQDTNRVQKAIIDALRQDQGQDQGQDQQQCFFAVGDLKQSVYGFRGADVSLFNDMHRNAGAGQLALERNYRSRAEVIDFINATGTLIWRNDDVISYTPLVSSFRYEKVEAHGPQVALVLVEKRKADAENGRDSADDSAAVHEREALAIALRIRRIVEGDEDSPALTVYDRQTKSIREARYGDIAILTKGRTHFATYERVLADLGIPAIADGGRGFFSGREVQDVLAALRVVANPYDEVALLAALRSPLFGWSDADLIALKAATVRDMWAACARGFTPRGESADPAAYQTIASLRRLRQSLPPVRLIQLLLDRTGYVAALLRTARGRAGTANVQKLLEFARQSAAVDGTDLRRFIQRAELAEDYLAQERDATVTAEGDDVVMLGTIHGSKGLEWPIVILAGLEANFDRSETGSFYSAADEALVIQPRGQDGKPIKPASQLSVMEAEKRRDEQEGRRLFYVGMTRARERLILCGECTPKDEVSLPREFGAPIKWLCAAAGITAANCDDRIARIGNAVLGVSIATEASVARIRGSIIADPPDLAAARRLVRDGESVTWANHVPDRRARISATVHELLNSTAPPLAPQGAPAVTTITQLVHFARCPMVYYFNLVLQIEEHPRKRRKSEVAEDRRYSAVEIGTAVHEMLERADFDAAPADEARRLVQGESSDRMTQHDRDRVEKMLASVLADPLIDRARGATELKREYPFYLSMDGKLVHGVIDLVFTDAAGHGVVVDYKSNDLAAPDRVNVLARYYEPQIEMYALAARKAGLGRVEEATLYFLNKSEARTFNVTQQRLDSAELQMRDSVERISRGAWDTEPGEKCRSCGYRKRGFCEVGKRFVE